MHDRMHGYMRLTHAYEPLLTSVAHFPYQEGFWYPAAVIRGMLAFQSNYKARCDDVILASSLKTGTT
ncbi:hypothetical protein CUMW_197450 [Citrus unshiu]|uniref:Sulfotransferase n=1 Tax=Citrus unshiu TaxID=55188 RepID=A0A2H5Q5B2_CITUN|nr:hypothetical protein CUMW_197450 [Citrus unshiu]